MTNPVDALVRVTVTTKEGDIYEFPSMSLAVVSEVVKSSSLHGFASLSLVNQSQVCLLIPTRIIATIAFEGGIQWRCPV